MTEIGTKMNAPQGKPLPEKRLYRQPALQVFRQAAPYDSGIEWDGDGMGPWVCR